MFFLLHIFSFLPIHIPSRLLGSVPVLSLCVCFSLEFVFRFLAWLFFVIKLYGLNHIYLPIEFLQADQSCGQFHDSFFWKIANHLLNYCLSIYIAQHYFRAELQLQLWWKLWILGWPVVWGLWGGLYTYIYLMIKVQWVILIPLPLAFYCLDLSHEVCFFKCQRFHSGSNVNRIDSSRQLPCLRGRSTPARLTHGRDLRYVCGI